MMTKAAYVSGLETCGACSHISERSVTELSHNMKSVLNERTEQVDTFVLFLCFCLCFLLRLDLLQHIVLELPRFFFRDLMC